MITLKTIFFLLNFKILIDLFCFDLIVLNVVIEKQNQLIF